MWTTFWSIGLKQVAFSFVSMPATPARIIDTFAGRTGLGPGVTDVSDQYVQLAIQGPRAEPVLQSLVDLDLADIRYYRCRTGHIQGVSGLIARTGYTGEDGFEVYFPPVAAEAVWEGLIRSGISGRCFRQDWEPRNTLRLEARMALYGHEISEDTTPWEAGLGWMVRMDKPDFTGKAALAAQL